MNDFEADKVFACSIIISESSLIYNERIYVDQSLFKVAAVNMIRDCSLHIPSVPDFESSISLIPCFIIIFT